MKGLVSRRFEVSLENFQEVLAPGAKGLRGLVGVKKFPKVGRERILKVPESECGSFVKACNGAFLFLFFARRRVPWSDLFLQKEKDRLRERHDHTIHFSFASDSLVSGYNNTCPTHSPSSFERMVDLNSDSFWQHEELWIQSLKVTALSAFNPDDSELKRQ